MPLICPHISGVYLTVPAGSSTSTIPQGTGTVDITSDTTAEIGVEFVECIEVLCQIWDTEHDQCGMLVSEHVGHKPDESRGTILEVMEHIHNRHLHQTAHDCATDAYTEASPGSECGADIDDKQPPPAALALVTEFVSNEDRDNNGQVYGVDFKIDSADPAKPTMLKSLEESPDFTATVSIYWATYLASLP